MVVDRGLGSYLMHYSPLADGASGDLATGDGSLVGDEEGSALIGGHAIGHCEQDADALPGGLLGLDHGIGLG